MILKKKYFVLPILVACLSVTSCSKVEDKIESVEEIIEQQANYVVYENIKFEVDTDGLDSKRFFSTSTGKMYAFNEITEEIGKTIDLAWYDSSPTNAGFLFWDSPDDIFQDEVIPGATATKIENSAATLNAEQFDLIKDASQLDELTVVHEKEAMGPIDYPIVVLFENSAGKKGAIKMMGNDGEFLTVEIKVVK